MSPFPRYFCPLCIYPALLHSLLKLQCLCLLIDLEVEATIHELHGLPLHQVLAEVGLGLLGAVAFFVERLGESKDEVDEDDPEMVYDEEWRMGIKVSCSSVSFVGVACAHVTDASNQMCCIG